MKQGHNLLLENNPHWLYNFISRNLASCAVFCKCVMCANLQYVQFKKNVTRASRQGLFLMLFAQIDICLEQITVKHSVCRSKNYGTNVVEGEIRNIDLKPINLLQLRDDTVSVCFKISRAVAPYHFRFECALAQSRPAPTESANIDRQSGRKRK